MADLSLIVPKEYGYVVMVAASTSFLGLWMSYVVGTHRKAAKVPYPNAYATATEAATSQEKYLFNCAQRAHANYLEHLTTVLGTLLIAGLRYPVTSAAMGASWIFFRVLYTIGYTAPGKEGGKGRYRGILHVVPEFSLAVMAGMVGYFTVVG